MKKKVHMKLRRKTRNIILMIAILFILIALIIIFQNVLIEKTAQKDVAKYAYSMEPAISYEVHMKDNELYDTNILKEDLYYFEKLTDYIDIKFSFNYQGNNKQPINIKYKTSAFVSGFVKDDSVKTTFWTKEFPITEEKTTQVNQMGAKIEEEIRPGIDEYKSFISRINKTTDFAVSNEITFSLYGTLVVDTPYGTVDQPFNLSLTSELNNNLLKFEKGGLDKVKDTLKVPVQIVLPLNIALVLICGGIGLFCLLLIIYLLVFTRDYDIYDTHISIAKKIRKDYGSRLVAIKNNSGKEYQYTFQVQSINDLIKISDELQKPLFYEMDDEYIIKDFNIYVQNGEDLYKYNFINEALEN